MPHQIITDLAKRYTTKHYDPTKRISQEDLDVIYEALRLSPSSINSQPWKFIVIESDEAKQRMHDSFANKFQFNQKHAKAASHIILFAHKTHYTREDFAKVVDKGIQDGRTQAENREQAFGSFAFAEMNTDKNGDTSHWTKAQTYIALGNLMHTLARLGIDSTPLEGVDHELLSEIFKDELEGYRCDVGLAMGYHHKNEDYNAALPKSRLALENVVTVI
ncbi:Major NAD(P)H-flavin oxidoreductase [Marinomonas spartinae]|uniref:nitroreductase family protein n=1 Tax=Marinomonas spartinae TaxID=1792290 RepID=UPI0008090AB0|nr:nitroreductase family protein [Marinomonas spartinae]SBS30366.1 Major NAD(P)H-flavin oxidoreductase [Marinomonas spartinae]